MAKNAKEKEAALGMKHVDTLNNAIALHTEENKSNYDSMEDKLKRGKERY